MGEETFVFWGDFPKFLARVMLSVLSALMICGCCIAAFILGGENKFDSEYPSCYRTFGDVFGQVVDESGQSVEGAAVRLEYSHQL